MNALSLLFLSCASLGAAPESLVLSFTSPDCPPCQQMAPIVTRLYRQGYEFRKVDVKQHPQIAERFQVRAVPTYVLLVGGQEADRIVGPRSEEQLADFARRAARPAAPNAAASARASAVSLPRSSNETAAADPPAKSKFSLPFLKGKSDESPQAESQPPQVVRAKLDGGESLEGGQSLDAAPADFEQQATPADPFAASTRIRIQDGSGASFGSGTIIDSRPGRSLVLTCGHVFRGLGRGSRIEVDLFENGRSEPAATYTGKVVHYDEEADVGLIAVAADDPLPAVRIAPPGYRVRRGDAVLNVGCSGGDPPSRQPLNVTALNRYLGPDNIECTGVPVQGRSGGGLFNGRGQVVGVCVAADPRDQRGLYAGLAAIHELLDQCGLERLYQPADAAPPSRPARPFNEDWDIVANDGAGRSPGGHSPAGDARSRREEDLREEASRRPQRGPYEQQGEFEREQHSGARNRGEPFASAIPADFSGDTGGENIGGNRFGALESRAGDLDGIAEVLDRTGEAEVVCIVRSLDDPQAASKVVIINRASSKFISYLTDELDPDLQPITTSLAVSGEEASRPGNAAAAQSIERHSIPEPLRYRRSDRSR